MYLCTLIESRSSREEKMRNRPRVKYQLVYLSIRRIHTHVKRLILTKGWPVDGRPVDPAFVETSVPSSYGNCADNFAAP